MIIASFCDKVKRGFYGQLGAAPIFPGNEEETNHLKAVSKGILEVKGLRMKSAQSCKIEDGLVITQKEIKSLKIEKNNKYLQIFPLSLLK